uniref:Uncharacterized protein n=1 Tax=Amazona collaria TaxID=241587 RepID=A0A8B9FPF7_9PSIT
MISQWGGQDIDKAHKTQFCKLCKKCLLLSFFSGTSKSEAIVAKTSRFDVGSFVGGILLTLGVLVILYIGCKTYHSRRGIQYRTIDEHDAII